MSMTTSQQWLQILKKHMCFVRKYVNFVYFLCVSVWLVNFIKYFYFWCLASDDEFKNVIWLVVDPSKRLQVLENWLHLFYKIILFEKIIVFIIGNCLDENLSNGAFTMRVNEKLVQIFFK